MLYNLYFGLSNHGANQHEVDDFNSPYAAEEAAYQLAIDLYNEKAEDNEVPDYDSVVTDYLRDNDIPNVDALTPFDLREIKTMYNDTMKDYIIYYAEPINNYRSEWGAAYNF